MPVQVFNEVKQTLMTSSNHLHESVIPPQTGVGFELKKGQFLKVIDVHGQQVSDLFCFAKQEPTNALSSGRTIDYGDTIYQTTGDHLYAQNGEVMLTITHDTCGRHDFLVTPCSCQMFQMMNNNSLHHPSCLENLEKAFANYPVRKEQIGTTFNIFMNIEMSNQGKIQVVTPLSKPGDFIIFQARMDLIVGLTACSDEGTNNGSCKPIHYQVLDQLN